MNHTTSKLNLGIITIATGRYYDEFIPTLKDSIDQYFDASQFQVQFYCFTDVSQVRGDIIRIPITHLAWPFSTLMRFYWIRQYFDALLKNDFLLYMDADMKVVQAIPSDIFLHDLIAVQHPGYLRGSPAFEVDRQESSYLAPQLRRTYYQGCFWGGNTQSFGQLIHSLSTQVEQDLKKATIPIWHDESYLNAYLAMHPCFALSAEFAWPAATPPKDRNPFILHLEKPHQEIRQMQGRGTSGEKILEGLSPTEALVMYQELYLIAHQKCQRLEARLMNHHGIWTRMREWLAYYKNKN